MKNSRDLLKIKRSSLPNLFLQLLTWGLKQTKKISYVQILNCDWDLEPIGLPREEVWVWGPSAGRRCLEIRWDYCIHQQMTRQEITPEHVASDRLLLGNISTAYQQTVPTLPQGNHAVLIQDTQNNCSEANRWQSTWEDLSAAQPAVHRPASPSCRPRPSGNQRDEPRAPARDEAAIPRRCWAASASPHSKTVTPQ